MQAMVVVVVSTTLVEGSPTAAVEEAAQVATTSSRVEEVEAAGKFASSLTRPTFAHDNVNQRTDDYSSRRDRPTAAERIRCAKIFGSLDHLMLDHPCISNWTSIY